jgi:hypothetical protein
MCAPLDINTIMDSIRWMKKSPHAKDAWRDNIYNMIGELALHDSRTYNNYCGDIVNACNKVHDRGLVLPAITRNQAVVQRETVGREWTF